MTSSKQDVGVPPAGSGHSQSGAAISGASPAEPSVPNASALATARKILRDDAYLAPYLLGWCGLGEAQPWGAAMSFAMEMAHGYNLIRGESDATPTQFGASVAAAFEEAMHG